MSIISWHFLVFTLASILVYYLTPKKFRWIPLIIFSILFYVIQTGWKVCFNIFSILQTYLFGLLLNKIDIEKKGLRRLVLVTCVILNLSVLVTFKYVNFFSETISLIFKTTTRTFDIVAFAGLSFYTFSLIGYIADVYCGRIKGDSNFFRFSLFVLYFPRILQGPIGFYDEDADKIFEAEDYNPELAIEGCFKITKGLLKKVLIADMIATFTVSVYANYANVGGLVLLLATFLYFVQLFADFSGFIDIMLGISCLFGKKLNENFNAPYLTTSVADFWRRWHISLSKWFTKYIYIPLGGSRKGKLRLFLNITIVFFISGLWHGASFNFIIWGLMHAILQIIGKLTLSLRNKGLTKIGLNPEKGLVKTLRIIVTMLLISLTWVPFFSPSFSATWVIYSKIFADWRALELFSSITTYSLTKEIIIISVLAIIFVVFYDHFVLNNFTSVKKLNLQNILCSCIALTAIVFGIIAINSNAEYSSSFIYFQF